LQRARHLIRVRDNLSNVAETDSTDVSWPDRAEVTDPTAIAMLTDLRALKFLMPFMSSTHTLTSAAALLGKPPSTVAYWLPRLVACGLLIHRGDLARAGASMPTYRAPARMLTIPYPSIPFDRRVALLDQGRMRILRRFLDGIDEELEAAGRFSISVTADGLTGTIIDLVQTREEGAARRYTDGWRTLELDEPDAVALARELEALITRYQDRHGRHRHVVHVGLVRDPRVRWRSVNDELPS
jgi:hypothetical protein